METMERVSAETYGTLAKMFEYRNRNGTQFVSLRDDAPEWAGGFVRDAHGTEMLPDDYRYAWIKDTLTLLSETEEGDDLSDLAHEFADNSSVYTNDLLEWLASHSARTGYVDAALEEGIVDSGADIVARISAGQYLERREVFESTVSSAANYAPLID